MGLKELYGFKNWSYISHISGGLSAFLSLMRGQVRKKQGGLQGYKFAKHAKTWYKFLKNYVKTIQLIVSV